MALLLLYRSDFVLLFVLVLLHIQMINTMMIEDEQVRVQQRMQQQEQRFSSQQQQQQRNMRDIVTQINDNECDAMTSLQTNYRGWEKSSTGIMFTVRASGVEKVELLTIEFEANNDISSSTPKTNVQVYYREGEDFSDDIINDSSKWTKLADTDAHMIDPEPTIDPKTLMKKYPSDKVISAIIPRNEFDSVTLNAGRVYSFYITLPISFEPEPSFLNIRPSDRQIGDLSDEDDVMKIQTGVRLDGAKPFPESYVEAADFNGVLHYQVNQPCKDSYSQRETQPVSLVFASDVPQSEKDIEHAQTEISESVVGIVQDIIDSNDELSSLVSRGLLKIDGVRTVYVDSMQDRCPDSYNQCTILISHLWFNYAPSAIPNFGDVKSTIYNETELIGTTVSSDLSFLAETTYVGKGVAKVPFVITLMGTPDSAVMTDMQKEYFEYATQEFLNVFAKTPRYAAKLIDILSVTTIEDTPETKVEEVDRQRRSLRKLSSSSIYQQAQRNAQVVTGGQIQIKTEIVAETDMQQLRAIVLDGLGDNQEMYVTELMALQMRPDLINDPNNDQTDFFSDLTEASVSLSSSSSSGGGGGSGSGSASGGGDASSSSNGSRDIASLAGMIACSLLIVLSIVWIVYRVYKDFFWKHPMTPRDQNKPDEDDEKYPTKGKRTSFNEVKAKRGKKKTNVRKGGNNDDDDSDQYTTARSVSTKTDVTLSVSSRSVGGSGSDHTAKTAKSSRSPVVADNGFTRVKSVRVSNKKKKEIKKSKSNGQNKRMSMGKRISLAATGGKEKKKKKKKPSSSEVSDRSTDSKKRAKEKRQKKSSKS